MRIRLPSQSANKHCIVCQRRLQILGVLLQANVKEPELYELCDRVREIRQALASADDGHKAEMQQQLAEPQAASQ